jgi:hypothetical protein
MIRISLVWTMKIKFKYNDLWNFDVVKHLHTFQGRVAALYPQFRTTLISTADSQRAPEMRSYSCPCAKLYGANAYGTCNENCWARGPRRFTLADTYTLNPSISLIPIKNFQSLDVSPSSWPLFPASWTALLGPLFLLPFFLWPFFAWPVCPWTLSFVPFHFLPFTVSHPYIRYSFVYIW